MWIDFETILLSEQSKLQNRMSSIKPFMSSFKSTKQYCAFSIIFFLCGCEHIAKSSGKKKSKTDHSGYLEVGRGLRGEVL